MQAVNLFFLLERASFHVNNKNKDHSDLLTFDFFFIFEVAKQGKNNWRLPVVNSLFFLMFSFRLPNWFVGFRWHISDSLSVFVLFPAINDKQTKNEND